MATRPKPRSRDEAAGPKPAAKHGGARPGAGRKSGGERPSSLVNVLGLSAYRDWLDALAEHDHRTKASLVEAALAHYARSVGFTEPAPRRV